MVAEAALMIAAGLAIGLGAGWVMHRSDYCLSGMFSGLFLFRETFMLRTLLLLVVSSMVLFEGGRRFGLLAFYPFPLLGSPSLSNLVGGCLFGVGMVLAGGCVVGTLYKMGSGSLTSFAAFLGLLSGSALYAEIHPFWAAFADATGFLAGKVTVAQVFGLDPVIPVLVATVPAAWLFVSWRRNGKWIRRSHARGYLQPWAAALLLAGLGFLSYLTVGMPLGITTSYAKMAGYVESFFFPGHAETLAYFQAIPLDVQNPLTGGRLLGGAAPVFDSIAVIQIPVIAGIVLGSALSSFSLGELKVYRNVPRRQIVVGFCGGALLGIASRMTPGCNVWHLLGGVPIFALQSMLFLAGLFPGAWFGGRIVSRII